MKESEINALTEAIKATTNASPNIPAFFQSNLGIFALIGGIIFGYATLQSAVQTNEKDIERNRQALVEITDSLEVNRNGTAQVLQDIALIKSDIAVIKDSLKK